MLILARRPLEWIDLTLPDGQIISLQVVRCSTQGVRIGIEADCAINIARREVRRECDAAAGEPLPAAS